MNNNAKAAIVLGIVLFLEGVILRIWNPTIITVPVYTVPFHVDIIIVCLYIIVCYVFFKFGEIFSNNSKVQSCL